MLGDEFVVGWQNVHAEPHVGRSGGYACTASAVGTSNGAGGSNVQLIVMAADLTVLHVLPGFWHPDDLRRELGFALQLNELWCDESRALQDKHRLAEVIRDRHVQGLPGDTIARSDWQTFAAQAEQRRCQKGQRDRHAKGHQEDDRAEQERERLEPFHYSCIPASPVCIRSRPTTKRKNSMAIMEKLSGKEIVSSQRG